MNNDTLSLSLSDSMIDHHYRLLSTKTGMAGFIKEEVDFKDRTIIEPTGDAIDAFPTLVDSVLHPGKKMVFMSDPLQENMTISGSFKVSIAAAINKKDMDIVIDLYAQMPDGKYLALNANVQRASYAKDRTTRHLLEPGKIENIELTNTFLTCIRLPRGSRIVVTVGVNLNPQWQINYGTGKDVSDEDIRDATIPLQIKWYNKSTIKIPIWK
jgi:predicted acyl esterase